MRATQVKLTALAVLAIVLCVSVAALGQNIDTWDGGGGDNNWGTGNNWVDNTAPPLGSIINFAGSTRTTPFFNYTSFDNMNRIFLNAGAAAFTLNGNSIKFVNNNGVPKIENNSTNKLTLGFANISFDTSGEINPVNGDIDVNLGGGAGSLFLDNSAVISVFGNNGFKLSFFTPLKNAGGAVVVKQASEVIFAAANTYSGDTTIEAGTVSYAAGGSTSSPFHRIGVDGGSAAGTLRITDADGGTTLTGGIVARSGTGARRIQATNTSGTNTYSGNIFLDGNVETSIASGGTIAFTGATINVNNQALTVNGAGNTQITNGLKNPDSGEIGSLIKNGAGALYLEGTSTYAGTTTVSNGALIVNGTHNGGDNYSIASGATLGGSGTIAPASGKSVSISGNVSPGNSVGNLTLSTTGGGVTEFAKGGSYTWEINAQSPASPAGTAWDQLTLGAVSVTATTITSPEERFTIKIVSLNGSTPGLVPGWIPGSPDAPKRYIIATSSSNSFLNVDLNKFYVDTTLFQNVYPSGWSLAIGNNGGSLDLVYVPEPGSLTTIIGSSAVLLRRRRRF
ncbi:MAG: autotransporter-associated beta strand repeat-containing protein [Anaerolineae bacterium]|nr:autotransporter-associated beta strand repeat-containing protein [Phycisphaerae bacterium]